MLGWALGIAKHTPPERRSRHRRSGERSAAAWPWGAIWRPPGPVPLVRSTWLSR